LELKSQQTHVLAVHPGYVDTDMTVGVEVPKMSALEVATAIYSALQRDESELVLSEAGVWIKQNLSSTIVSKLLLSNVQSYWRTNSKPAKKLFNQWRKT
jgi:short-subunit dehydrogenase